MADIKIYGPYIRADGRKHIIKYDGKHRTTQSYPRYLMEQFLNRELLEDETVDHINGNFLDDRIENLQLLSRAANISKSSSPPEIGIFTCPICNEDFELEMRFYRHNQLKQNKKGPYCSKSCSGKVNN